MEANNNDLRKYVFQQIALGGNSKNKVIDYLLSIENFKSFNDFKEIIKIMIDIKDMQRFYYDKVLEKIRKVYTWHLFQHEELTSFTNELFLSFIELGEKYSLYYSLYQKFKFEENYTFPITESELKDICFARLKHFVDSKTKNIDKCSNLYYLCRDHVDENNNVVLQDRAHKKRREYVNNYPWEYINFLIRPYGTPIYRESWPGFTIEPFVKQTFGGWDNFYIFLEEQKEKMKNDTNYERLLKYIAFFNEFKFNNYKPFTVEEKNWHLYGIDKLKEENNWLVV
jgi:hypothetical protein